MKSSLAAFLHDLLVDLENLRLLAIELRNEAIGEAEIGRPDIDAVDAFDVEDRFHVLDREEPEILKIYEKIVKECGKRGLYPGIHCSGAEGAVRAINMGFRMVTLFNEVGLMATYARMQIAQTRKESGGKA